MYSKKTKELILNLLHSGYAASELAKSYGVNAATIARWRKKGAEEGGAMTIQNLKAQIATLSKGKSSDSKAKQIAMLTASLSRLQGAKAKEQKVKNKKKPIALMNGAYESLKEIALKSGELFDYQKDFLIIGNQNAITYKEIFN